MRRHAAARSEIEATIAGLRSALLVLAVASTGGCASVDPGSPFDDDLDGISGLDSVGSLEDDTGSDDDAELRLDVGVSHDGCRYVDLLFVIDNSGSMCAAQEGLARVLPDLVDAMFDALPPGTDVHVGLTTTSFSPGGSVQQANCAALASDSTIAEYYVTNEHRDGNGFQGRLYRHEGKAYFAANTDDPGSRAELAAWFPDAVASVGCSGGAYEFTAAAAAYALHPANEEHNGGFVRDEGAALVVFTLSDEVDLSMESISTYRETILEAKSGCGGEACIVTAGLLGTNCVPDANPVIWQFLNAFGKAPVWGDIADFDAYTSVLADALATSIVQTCETIGPVG